MHCHIIIIYPWEAPLIVGARDQFRSGGGVGLRSLARIFSPSLARKSSGFAEYYLLFARKWALESFLSGGGGGGWGWQGWQPPKLARLVYAYATGTDHLNRYIFYIQISGMEIGGGGARMRGIGHENAFCIGIYTPPNHSIYSQPSILNALKNSTNHSFTPLHGAHSVTVGIESAYQACEAHKSPAPFTLLSPPAIVF